MVLVHAFRKMKSIFSLKVIFLDIEEFSSIEEAEKYDKNCFGGENIRVIRK